MSAHIDMEEIPAAREIKLAQPGFSWFELYFGERQTNREYTYHRSSMMHEK